MNERTLCTVSSGGHVDNTAIRCGLADKLSPDQIQHKIVVDWGQIASLVGDKRKLHL